MGWWPSEPKVGVGDGWVTGYQGCTPRPGPGKNSCPGLLQPQKFSRLPPSTPPRPKNAPGLTVAPPWAEAKTLPRASLLDTP